MTTRADMLNQVQKALQRPNSGSPGTPLPPIDLTGVMPPLVPEDYLSKFEAEWEKVGGVAYRVTTMDELEAVFEKILVLAETQAVVLSRNPLLAKLGIPERLTKLDKFITTWATGPGVAGTDSLSDFTKASFEAGSGITGVDFVLAESGTLVLSSATEGVQVACSHPPFMLLSTGGANSSAHSMKSWASSRFRTLRATPPLAARWCSLPAPAGRQTLNKS